MSTTTFPTSPANVSPSNDVNSERREAFGERLAGMLNEASLSFMLSIGHRSGLLDVLKAIGYPATSQQIAYKAGLNERYVREWLGALVTGGVLDYEPMGLTYQLPAEHAAWLTREATPNNGPRRRRRGPHDRGLDGSNTSHSRPGYNGLRTRQTDATRECRSL